MRKVQALTVLFFIAGVSVVTASDWSTFHHDAARTGNSEDKKIKVPLKLLWKYQARGAVRSSPAVVGGVVYIGSYDHKVYALESGSGKVKWSYITGGAVHSSPAVSDGLVYVGSADGVLYALDAKDGGVKWRYTVKGDNTPFMWEGLFRATSCSILSSPCVADGIVYFGSGPTESRGGAFYALDAKTGQVKWQCETRGGMCIPPALAEGTVYFIEHEGLQARDAKTGQLKWIKRYMELTDTAHGWYNNKKDSNVGGTTCWLSGLSVGEGNIYLTVWGWMGNVAAVEMHTGEVKWLHRLDSPDISFFSSGAICEGIVYFGFRYNRGQVQGFRTDEGSTAQKFPIYGVNSSPAVANGLLFAGADDGNVYACELESGKVLWSYGTEGKVRSSPALAEGKLFIGSDDGNIYAFGPVE